MPAPASLLLPNVTEKLKQKMGTLQGTLTEEREAWGSMFQKESQAGKPARTLRDPYGYRALLKLDSKPLLEEGLTVPCTLSHLYPE